MHNHPTSRESVASKRLRLSHLHRSTLGCIAGVSIAMFAVDADASDALHCFKITDRALAGAARSDLGGDVPPGCSIVRGAALACMRASITDAGHEAADGLLFDRLCYEVRCSARAAAGEPSASDATTRLDDALGGHTFGRDAADLVCTPATITIATEQSVHGKGRSHGGSAEGSAAAKEVTLRQCGDFSADNSISASDALGVLKVAIGSKTCLPCVCDVDKSGTFTATDALTVLKKAVGQAVTLNCDPDGNPVTWTGGGDGTSWEDPANWNLSTRIPNLCDDVTISQTGFTVVHGDDDNGALRINASSSLDLDSGLLELRDTMLVNGTFRVSGGTLKNATVLSPTAGLTAATDGDPPPVANITLTSNGGLLDGVTLNDDMDMSATSAGVRVENGLTLNGTASMGNGANLHFQSGDQTLDGSGDISFGAVGNKYLFIDNGMTLTIAPTISIHGAVGQVGTSGGLVNQGLIDSDQPGEIEVTSTQGWTNEGTVRGRTGGDLRLSGTWTNNSDVSIADGGVLTLLGTWTNAGTITSDASTVNLGGTFSLAALGDFQRTGGTVNLTGTFINSTNLALDATTGDWNLVGGTIQGGSVSGADGAELVLTSSGGLLDAVTMDSGMDLTATSANARVQNGLTLNGTADMGNGANLHFQSGDQTLDGSGDISFGAVGNKYLFIDNGMTLTIAPTISIHGGTGQVGTTGGVVNEGLIDSDAPGEIEVASTQGWSNHATMRASGGDLATSGTGTNSGTIEISAGQKLTARNGFVQDAAGTLSIEIAGTSSFGQVKVTGAATLAGTLDVTLGGGFSPNIGDTFTIMTFGSHAGDFATVNGLDIGGGKRFDRTFTATEMILEVVPQ